MRQLSPAGQQAIDDTARRHGISMDATLSMLDAVVRGNGSMAQFGHPEFSGSGPVLSVNGQPVCAPPAPIPAAAYTPTYAPSSSGSGQQQDVFATFEKLADLRSKGVLDEAEFQAKKAELLGRL